MQQVSEVKHNSIDELEAALLGNFETVDCPVTHRFTEGMYIREIFMPKGSVVTSLIHKTNHPFFILKGKVSVFSENDGKQLLEAPYVGITTPNTRRVLKIHEDCIWATCHPTDIQPKDNSEESILEAVNLVRDAIIEPHENSVLMATIINNKITNNINSSVCHGQQ